MLIHVVNLQTEVILILLTYISTGRWKQVKRPKSTECVHFISNLNRAVSSEALLLCTLVIMSCTPMTVV